MLSPERFAGHEAQRVQDTNLQHALILAGRRLAKHPDAEPVVLVVDGELTAHLTRTGRAEFCWPPLPETLELTMAEVERVTRRGATINVFMLDDKPRLLEFVEHLAARNGGWVFPPIAHAEGTEGRARWRVHRCGWPIAERGRQQNKVSSWPTHGHPLQAGSHLVRCDFCESFRAARERSLQVAVAQP